jgi:hypothetical protein
MISLGPYEVVPEEDSDGHCLLNITKVDDGEGYGPNATIDLATLFDNGVHSKGIGIETDSLGR